MKPHVMKQNFNFLLNSMVVKINTKYSFLTIMTDYLTYIFEESTIRLIALEHCLALKALFITIVPHIVGFLNLTEIIKLSWLTPYTTKEINL